MATADGYIRQGDTTPALTQTLLDASGNPLNLAGATVTFVMRALTANAPIVNAPATVVAEPGQVSYQWVAGDTAVPGMYMGEFHVVFPNGQTYTWPNDGYLSISIEDNLTTPGGAQIVSLPEVKDYLNLPAGAHTKDAKLKRLIAMSRPVVENIVGHVVQETIDEFYDGGQTWIELRHIPVLQLLAVSEWRGPIEYPLTIVADPAHGSTYSVEFDGESTIRRRSPGGSIIAFPYMPQSVRVRYVVGCLTVPDNIREGTLELIRVNYQGTQEAARAHFAGGSGGAAEDEVVDTAALGFLIPNRVREMLEPDKRSPSIA